VARRGRFALAPWAGFILVAPRIKVMYCPTTKVACSSLKLLLARANGSYDAARVEKLVGPHIARSQTIHERRVNGLPKLVDLPLREIQEVLASPEWLRVYATRDPLARAYSAWENRIFSRAPGTPDRAIELCPDELADGRIDVAASFARFARAIAEHTDAFMEDHHFLPQTHIVQPDRFDYTMRVRVEEPEEMARLVAEVNRRADTRLELERHNQGFGIPLAEVCDQHTANRLAATYAMDHERFGYPTRTFAAIVAPRPLGQVEASLLRSFRGAVEQLQAVSFSARSLAGVRFGARQIWKSLARHATLGRAYRDPAQVHW
jgi:hypothetical protein